MKSDLTQVGIGFATGRKGFRKVLGSYIYNWEESGLVDNESISLNLFIAYDLSYAANTCKEDFVTFLPEWNSRIDSKMFIGEQNIRQETDRLVRQRILSAREAELLFGQGYAGKRNIVLYYAIKNNMDYLLFLDDDEYPVAVTNTKKTAVWGGQHVLSKHLEYLGGADITHGRHCGYISPIPYIDYDDRMTESDFQTFIEAISNDILNWDNIRKVMEDGGVTYADTQVLTSEPVIEVEEQNRSKFISGSNLGINLKDPGRVFPFYNPPGARGEDTFLSTCLSERKVLRIPCYTFHDGFSTYNRLLEGMLPIRLKQIRADDEMVAARFYRACLGWIRYKPLLVYITRPESYDETIRDMRKRLNESVPKICEYFGRPEFMNILSELEKYHKSVRMHYFQFLETKNAWARLMNHICSNREVDLRASNL